MTRSLHLMQSRYISHGLRALCVALCAAMHFGWATPSVMIQENFGDFDVPWRRELVKSWHPPAGEYALPDRPGLGIELDDAICARHPYQKSSFPSLWDDRWLKEFTKAETAKTDE